MLQQNVLFYEFCQSAIERAFIFILHSSQLQNAQFRDETFHENKTELFPKKKNNLGLCFQNIMMFSFMTSIKSTFCNYIFPCGQFITYLPSSMGVSSLTSLTMVMVCSIQITTVITIDLTFRISSSPVKEGTSGQQKGLRSNKYRDM